MFANPAYSEKLAQYDPAEYQRFVTDAQTQLQQAAELESMLNHHVSTLRPSSVPNPMDGVTLVGSPLDNLLQEAEQHQQRFPAQNEELAQHLQNVMESKSALDEAGPQAHSDLHNDFIDNVRRLERFQEVHKRDFNDCLKSVKAGRRCIAEIKSTMTSQKEWKEFQETFLQELRIPGKTLNCIEYLVDELGHTEILKPFGLGADQVETAFYVRPVTAMNPISTTKNTYALVLDDVNQFVVGIITTPQPNSTSWLMKFDPAIALSAEERSVRRPTSVEQAVHDVEDPTVGTGESTDDKNFSTKSRLISQVERGTKSLKQANLLLRQGLFKGLVPVVTPLTNESETELLLATANSPTFPKRSALIQLLLRLKSQKISDPESPSLLTVLFNHVQDPFIPLAVYHYNSAKGEMIDLDRH